MSATKKQQKSKPVKAGKKAKAKPEQFAAGDQVEFRLSEGSPRPEGSATVTMVDPIASGGKAYMYLLEVIEVFAGDPGKIRNPSGELWAQDGELFRPGTRACLAATLKPLGGAVDVSAYEKPLAAGMPPKYREAKKATGGALLLFRSGKVYEAFNGDAALVAIASKHATEQREAVAVSRFPVEELDSVLRKLVAGGHQVAVCEQTSGPKLVDAAELESKKPETEAKAGALLEAAKLLKTATRGTFDLVVLAGDRLRPQRKRLAALILGREPEHDEYGVSGLRRLIGQAAGLASDSEAGMDAEIEAWAPKFIVENQETTKEEQPKSEAIETGAGQAMQSTAPATGGDDFMAKQAAKLNGKSKKTAVKKSTSTKSANRGTKGLETIKQGECEFAKTTRGVRGTLFGVSFTAAIRYMGKAGMNFKGVRATLDKFGAKDVADATIKTQLGRAHRGEGEIPTLSADARSSLLAFKQS